MEETMEIGKRVEGGELAADYDTGSVISVIDARTVMVAWDSGVTTRAAVSRLRPEGTAPPRAPRWTTYGSSRGLGPVRESRDHAERDLEEDCDAIASLPGGNCYSDRRVYEVDADGYLVREDGTPVMLPGGSRGVRVR